MCFVCYRLLLASLPVPVTDSQERFGTVVQSLKNGWMVPMGRKVHFSKGFVQQFFQGRVRRCAD